MQNKRFEHFFLLHHHASRLDLAHSKLELVSNITTIENGAKGVSLLLFIPTPKGLRNVNKDDFARVFVNLFEEISKRISFVLILKYEADPMTQQMSEILF